ncbi:MAG: MBL fold metallo-hydrolase [Candidatus Dojkabacteria bacterium]|jgi:L-ascorbate metabolism protein UlaG (beta-lactamase superfamily)|nr:MBL fold metallo-hydrolase [Candidatus Dojkabacteria bacterium]
MKVKYYGNSSLLFKGKKTKLITNPLDREVKLNLKKVLPDIIVQSHSEEIPVGEYFMIKAPGEYEVHDFYVYGYKSDVNDESIDQADIYMIDVEGVHVGLIDKSVEDIRGRILDEMGIVDVLCISLAEESGMKLTKITDLVNKIEPYMVIPMDYNKKLLEDFAKVVGVQELEEVKDLDVAKSDFESEEMPMRIVVLQK